MSAHLEQARAHLERIRDDEERERMRANLRHCHRNLAGMDTDVLTATLGAMCEVLSYLLERDGERGRG